MHVYGKAEAILCRRNGRSGANPLLSANPASVSLSASQQIFQPQRFSGKFLGCLSQVCLYMCDFFLRHELRFRPWLRPWIAVTQASCRHATPFLTLQSSGGRFDREKFSRCRLHQQKCLFKGSIWRLSSCSNAVLMF